MKDAKQTTTQRWAPTPGIEVFYQGLVRCTIRRELTGIFIEATAGHGSAVAGISTDLDNGRWRRPDINWSSAGTTTTEGALIFGQCLSAAVTLAALEYSHIPIKDRSSKKRK